MKLQVIAKFDTKLGVTLQTHQAPSFVVAIHSQNLLGYHNYTIVIFMLQCCVNKLLRIKQKTLLFAWSFLW